MFRRVRTSEENEECGIYAAGLLYSRIFAVEDSPSWNQSGQSCTAIFPRRINYFLQAGFPVRIRNSRFDEFRGVDQPFAIVGASARSVTKRNSWQFTSRPIRIVNSVSFFSFILSNIEQQRFFPSR